MNGESVDFSRWSFLVVDDSPQVRLLVSKMLARCDAAKVYQAANGSEALDIMVDVGKRLDCLICDWNMEPIDGLSLLAAVRTGAVEAVSRELKTIMLTGHSDKDIVDAALSLSVTGFLVKPVSLEKLIKTVKTVMARECAVQSAQHYLNIPTVKLPDTLRLSRELHH